MHLQGSFSRAPSALGLAPTGTCVAVRQLTAVDGRRAFVTLPNDPELVDILAKNGVDISVSEGDQQGNYVSLLGAHKPAECVLGAVLLMKVDL